MSNSYFFKAPLYRDTVNGKIFGVCSGLARSLNLQAWEVRAVLLFVAFITAFGPVVIGYLLAFFILDPAPVRPDQPTKKENVSSSFESQFESRLKEAKSVFKKDKQNNTSKATSVELEDVKAKILAIKVKIEKIEAYVTSKHFEFDQEFSKFK